MTLPAKAGRTTRPAASSVDGNGLKMVRTRPFSTDWLKLPRALEFGRHRADDGVRPLVVPLLEGREAEDLAALDRAAERGAVHLQRGAAQRAGVLAGARRSRVGDRVQAADRGRRSRSSRGAVLVPDFMFRLMMPPRLWPFSASTLFFETVTSSTASIGRRVGGLEAGAERARRRAARRWRGGCRRRRRSRWRRRGGTAGSRWSPATP